MSLTKRGETLVVWTIIVLSVAFVYAAGIVGQHLKADRCEVTTCSH